MTENNQKEQKEKEEIKEKQPSLFGLLKPYAWLTIGLILLGFASNCLNLFLPKIISKAIDSYTANNLNLNTAAWQFFWLSIGTFLFAYFQSVAQTYASEKVAKDMRRDLISKISEQSYSYIQDVTAGKLLTNLTSDVDNIKTFVAQAVVTIISSLFLVIGGAILMFLINWKLALAVMLILPVIGIVFAIVFSKLQPLFKKIQGVTDRLNRIINESVLGAALVRVFNSEKSEYNKFEVANSQSRDLGVDALKLFAVIFPVIGFIANFATLIILVLGGYFVIGNSMTIGNFTAFMSYLGIIIFPIIMIGFMSTAIGRASASYGRVYKTLTAPEKPETGTLEPKLIGDVSLKDINLTLGGHPVLKNVSFDIKSSTKNAIIGPTAAGKTHLLYLLIGILEPDSGMVLYDGKNIHEYKKESLHQQVGFVFQDSSIFNLSVRENIAFNKTVTDADLKKAIDTAELGDFVESLRHGLDTIVSERGSSLSGGQKQRIMLARALALDPKVLLLDDFTARVDESTEKKILENITKNYPQITLISVTQKIASVEEYDQIILLMEGEILGSGTHKELMADSPEYVQIFESQQSTNTL